MSNTPIDKHMPTTLSSKNTSFINFPASTVDNTESKPTSSNDLTIEEKQQSGEAITTKEADKEVTGKAGSEAPQADEQAAEESKLESDGKYSAIDQKQKILALASRLAPQLHLTLPRLQRPSLSWIRRQKAPTASDIPVALSRRHNWRQHLSSLTLLALLFFTSVIPLSISVNYEVNAYTTYQALRSHASTGMQHLLNVKQIFVGTRINSTSVLDPDKLSRANRELAAGRQDFVQVQALLDAPSVHLVNQYLPQYRAQIRTARAASQIGIDLADIGQNLISCILTLEPRFRSPLLTTDQSPLVTSTDIDLIGTTIDSVIPRLDDMQHQLPAISLNDVPISTQTRSQLQQFIPLLPQVRSSLVEIRGILEPAKWLLGVNEPRTFLVQTMDRGELRPTGGFTGQYGELQIHGGRVAPFSLHDVALLEYGGNSSVNGHFAPSPYRSWWPFANWGLRDSNLSADFPTSAKIAMEQYKSEVKHDVDGVILLSPFLIQHILRVIGPVQIPNYNETITAENLEQRLHYYQLDNAGIRRSEIIEHVEDPATARKLFTAAVTRTLMERIRHAPLNELIAIGLQLQHDLKTKDLQIYVANQQIEELLQRYGYSAEIDRSTTRDGLYVVQTNVSASKASQYVQTKLQDTVTLDAQGGATHVLQMHLIYNQLGPVYGLDTYRDYVRVYVPPSAKFLWGNGFDSGQPLCGGPLPACSANGVYPDQELVCPKGQYQAGYAAPMLGDPYAGGEHPLDKIGKPTTFQSDEPERNMFGGYVVVPKNCSMMVTLSWYVPPIEAHPYSLLIQRQSGTYPEITLTVQPYPGDCATQSTTGLYFNGVLTEDSSFALKQASTNRATQSDCALKT